MGDKHWANTWTEIEDLGNGKFGATISVGHRVFFDKADGNKPKKHKLTDARPGKDYVLVQGAKCCVEVHPYYAKYYDVNHEEVRLYEERWVVQRLFKEPDTWRAVGAYNSVMELKEEDSRVSVTVTYQTDYGKLTVRYAQGDGNNLAHHILYVNESGATETFRVLQRWAGIVGAKCNGKDYPLVTDEPFLAFCKADGKLSIAENLRSMMFKEDGSEKTDQCLQRPISIETHAQGMKADFIYGNWVLAQNESLIIDPSIATLSPPSDDVAIVDAANDSGAWIKFNVSSISFATATLARLKLYQDAIDDAPDTDATFWNINSQAWTDADTAANIFALPVSDQTDQASGFGNGNEAWYESVDIKVIVNKDLLAGNTYCSIRVFDPDYPVNDGLLKDPAADWSWLGVGHCWGIMAARVGHNFESSEHPDGHDPTLYVEYTMPSVPVADGDLIGIPTIRRS